MNDVDASGFELLLSDPQIVAWLEGDDGDDEEED
jgi:hypothetical protein